MTVATPVHRLEFGDQASLDASLAAMARRLRGSEILRIAAEVRAAIRRIWDPRSRRAMTARDASSEAWSPNSRRWSGVATVMAER